MTRRCELTGKLPMAGQLRSHADAFLEIAELINKLKLKGLPSGKDPSVGYGLHVSFRQVPAPCNRFYELAVYIIDDPLQ